jgi:pimeloyl-ACP methyl ester carboxylesterase
VHYRVWAPDDVQRPLLLFVHGYRGHTHWWDWVAPAFTDRFRVAALDLSGMGKSEPRAHYSAEGFSADVLGVLTALAAREATVVGHSYGGTSVLGACAQEAERVHGRTPLIGRALVVDTFVRFPESDGPPVQPSSARGQGYYPNFEAARERYRLIPDQPVQNSDLLDYVARTSIHQTGGGWRWCFDACLPSAPMVENGAALLRQVYVPVDVIHGERSTVLDAARAMTIANTLPHGRGPISIPEAHHHIMIDQPIALISVLRALLSVVR